MKIKILTTLVAVALLAGCSNKWIDKAKPNDGSLTPDIMFSSEGGVTNAMTGLYAMVREYEPWSAPGNNGGTHNVYGYRTQIFGLDMMGNDLITYAPYGYFNGNADWNAVAFNRTGEYTATLWISFYKYINNANSIIKGVSESTALPEEFQAATIAEAKVIRAWSYFQLSRLYQNTYATSKDQPCVPIYDKPATAAEQGQPRSTVAQVYAFIMDDLTDEILNAIPTAKAQPYRIARGAAYAVRAQVKLQMEDWGGAQADAATAIGAQSADYPLMSIAQYEEGFNTLNQEVLWGLDINQTQGRGITSFAAFAAADYATFPYFCTYVNRDFKALFSPTDVRGQQIMTRNEWLGIAGAPDPNASTYLITAKFLSKYDFEMDDYLIRASEMVLIQAEGFARSGNPTSAQDMLFFLQKARDPQAEKTTKTGDALIEEILVERRKELYGEIGVEYFDLYRLNRPLKRTGNHAPGRMFQVPGGGTDWKLQVPQQENQSNPNNSDAVNNPVRTTPVP